MVKDTKSNTAPKADDLQKFLKERTQEVDPLQKVKDFKYVNDTFKKKPVKRVAEIMKQKLKKRKLFFVIMHLNNGKYRMMTVATSKNFFVYDTGAYYIDADMVREDTNSKMNVLYYHQSSSLPLRIDVDLDELRDTLQRSGSKEIEKTINPRSLNSFIESQIIEKVLKGAEMLKDLSQIKMLVVINTIAIVGLALLLARSTGMF